MDEASTCVQCEKIGEFSYHYLKSHLLSEPAKIFIRNLPPNISQAGIKNLLLGVGVPISIIFNKCSDAVTVEFNTINEAELAIRDLNKKPPYFLKVDLAITKFDSKSSDDSNEISWENLPILSCKDIRKKEPPSEFALNKNYFEDKCINDKNFLLPKKDYDPSIRMRQRNLDNTTKTSCISFGRGYMNMGSGDRFLGGLQTKVFSSENHKFKDEISCINCSTSTLKACPKCLVPFCSMDCLNNTELHQSTNYKQNGSDETKQKICYRFKPKDRNSSKEMRNSMYLPLRSSCTVIITTFITLRTIYVRRIDDSWDDKFIRFSNSIAIEAMKDKKLETTPKVGDLCISRYYKDMCYYRAKISSIEQDVVIVFFVDFGNSQKTKLCDIKPLSEEFKLIPEYAVKVQVKDIPELSSAEGVSYYNKLTAESIPLTMKFAEDSSSNEVFLIENDTGQSVNQTVVKLITPAWKKNSSLILKSGEVFYFEDLKLETLKVNERYNLRVCYLNKTIFFENGIFWVNNIDSDSLHHVKYEMSMRLMEYCEFLEDEHYLPRINELCFAQNKGQWYRCVNFKMDGTACCLFFVDEGYSLSVEAMHIRKFIEHFTEAPAQAICCALAENLELESYKSLQSDVNEYITSLNGQTISSALVKECKDDVYYLSIDDFKMLSKN